MTIIHRGFPPFGAAWLQSIGAFTEDPPPFIRSPAPAGMRLAHTDTGDGPPIVLLHGGGSGRATWDGFARALPGWRVIAPDLRGHGASPRCGEYHLQDHADDVAELLETLGLPPAVL